MCPAPTLERLTAAVAKPEAPAPLQLWLKVATVHLISLSVWQTKLPEISKLALFFRSQVIDSKGKQRKVGGKLAAKFSKSLNPLPRAGQNPSIADFA